MTRTSLKGNMCNLLCNANSFLQEGRATLKGKNLLPKGIRVGRGCLGLPLKEKCHLLCRANFFPARG